MTALPVIQGNFSQCAVKLMLLPPLSPLLEFLQVSFSCYMEERKWHSPAVSRNILQCQCRTTFSPVFFFRGCASSWRESIYPYFIGTKHSEWSGKGRSWNGLSTCNFASLRSLGGRYTYATSTYLQALRRFQPGSTFRHGHHMLCRSPQKRPKACQPRTAKDWKCSQDQGIGQKGWLWKHLLDLMSQKDKR